MVTRLGLSGRPHDAGKGGWREAKMPRLHDDQKEEEEKGKEGEENRATEGIKRYLNPEYHPLSTKWRTFFLALFYFICNKRDE